MGRNLGPLNIKDSYEGLVQISGSQLTDGSGSLIPNVDVTASNATTAVSSSYALTASFAENVVPQDTGSFVITGSVTNATLTFTKGDATTFPLTVDNVANATSASYAATATSASHAINADSALAADTATSSSYALTASYAENAGGAVDTGSLLVTASVVNATTTYTKGDGSTFDTIIDNVTTANTASYVLGSNVDGTVATATSASHALVADTATTATTATTASYAISSSQAENAETAVSSSYALTASFAENAPVSDPFPYTGSAIISGSLEVTGSVGIDNLLHMADNEISGSITYDDANQYSIIGANNVTFDNFNADSYVKGNESVLVAANGTRTTFQRALRVSGSVRSVMMASSQCAMGTNLGSTGTAENQAIIASFNSVIAGGVPYGGIYSVESGTINGSGNPRTACAIFGGQNALINQSFGCQLYGGDDNRIPNGFVDRNQIYGGSNNDITGGQRQLIVGSENGVISAGSRNRIMGGNNHLISNGTGYATILGGYNHDITGGTYANIVGGRDCLISAGGSVATILGSRSSTINGSTGAVDTVGISLGQQNQITSGYGDYIFGGRENKFENRSTNSFASVIVGAYNSRIHGSTTGQSAILGGTSNDLGVTADVQDSAIIAGNNHDMQHDRSVIIGGTGITSTKNDEVAVPNLTVSGSSIYEVGGLTFLPGSSTNMVCEASNYFTLDMGQASTTDLVPVGIQAGQEITLKVTQNATAASTLTFDNSIEWAGGVKPTLSPGLGAVDVFKFTSFGGGITYGSIVGQNFS